MTMPKVISFYLVLAAWMQRIAPVIPPLALRLILAWEFGESGYEKLMGTNWFADVTFPFPFSLLPADVSWQLSMWFELVGALALLLGVATRFFAISLMVLTTVAIAAVHWPEHWHTVGELLKGYRIVDEDGDGFGNYKLPVIYLAMFLPLLFGGAGYLSLDGWLSRYFLKGHRASLVQ
ncbi:putative oxidoreductase [Novimethylophilus kurashikiensis]|uniref:Putative oxidoreductase n=1 Tax=Novimethylophilus kurashikiensis TaxID=1825523 RepID=A0A2R5F7B1_9PROT|nr:putative oxidoreductase [Novimethylophilus kurashikiensis]